MDTFRHGTASGYSYRKCRCEECRAWKKAESRRYYEANREKVKARALEWYEANREDQAKKRQAYYEANPEKRAAKNEANAKWQRDNPDRVNTRNRRWRRHHPWRAWFANWLARERKRGQVYAPETLEWIKGLEGSACEYCGEPAQTIDHVLARSRGGSNSRENLVPACNVCNRRKSNLPLAEFMRRMKEEY